MEHPFIAENTRERNRLRSLVERLTEEELKLPLGDGWTVAVALAHLSFWDQRSLFVLRKWQKDGVELSPVDMDIENDALLVQWLAIPYRRAAELAIASAEAVDREEAQLSDEMVTAIERIGDRYRLYRSIHRKLHLDQIEVLLDNREASGQ